MASVARDWLTAIFFSVQLLCLPLLLSLPAALELVLFSIENKAILISLCTLYFFLSFLLFSLRISSLLKHFLKIYCLKIGCANEELHPPFFIFFYFLPESYLLFIYSAVSSDFMHPVLPLFFSVHVPNPLFEVCWPASQLGETHQLHRCLSYSIQVVWKASELE